VNAVTLAGATLAYGERVVLRDISLAIGERDFVALLGPNGAGKTTLLRAILGLVPLRAGSLRVLGAPARRGHPGIGYLPQARRAAPHPRLVARDFLACCALHRRWGPPRLGRAVRREAEAALDLVGAAPLGPRPLADLSGGERQRVLLATALLGRPRLLLLDEPLASLDPNVQREAVLVLRRVQHELGITVLLSAHQINPLLGAANQVLYLAGGAAALGPVDRVITGPMLSRLYGAPMEVVRLGGRIFVLPGQAVTAENVRDHAAV